MKDTYTTIELMTVLGKVTEKPLITLSEEQRKKATPDMFIFSEVYCAGAKAVVNALIGSYDDEEIDKERMLTEASTVMAKLMTLFGSGEKSASAVGVVFHAGEPESEGVDRA